MIGTIVCINNFFDLILPKKPLTKYELKVSLRKFSSIRDEIVILEFGKVLFCKQMLKYCIKTVKSSFAG
jgi:hypothetical protein